MSIDGPTKLLIAEDTDSVRDVLQRQLNKLGVEATFVENGVEAVKAVESGEYGILLTDLHMPEMDGYEVVKNIREEDEKLGRNFSCHCPYCRCANECTASLYIAWL